mgnify:CR=1 FL=1
MAIGTLPINPAGSFNTNRVVADTRTIPGTTKRVVLAKEGPLFCKSLEVAYTNTSGTLINLVCGVDYNYAYPFIKASNTLKSKICSGITLASGLTGSVHMSYNALGGSYGLTQAAWNTLEDNDSLQPEHTSLDYAISAIAFTQDYTNEVIAAFSAEAAKAVTTLAKSGLKLVVSK